MVANLTDMLPIRNSHEIPMKTHEIPMKCSYFPMFLHKNYIILISPISTNCGKNKYPAPYLHQSLIYV